MADIKVREVNKGSIKTLDRSITASKRIRNAASEIREQAGRVQYGNESEHNANEYASSEMQRAIGQSAYIAKRAAVKSAPYAKSGTEKAIQAYRIKQAEKKISTQRIKATARKSQRIADGLDIKESVSISNHRLRAIQSNAQKNYTIRRLQRGMISRHNSIIEKAGYSKGVTDGFARVARMIATSTKNMITAIVAGGWVAIAVVICCVLFGAAFYFFGDAGTESYIPVSDEVEAYTPIIRKYASEYGIPQYVELVKAVMMQESGGKGKDPMQASECKYNAKYPKKPSGIKDPEYSIYCGVRYLADNLDIAKAKSPVDMDRIKLAIQGYNFGSGYIPWAVKKYGGYSYSGAVEFSEQQAKKNGWKSYGDADYVDHVLRYYPYGNYSYDVINTGPGKLGLPLKGMKRGNISSHFGPRSSPGGFGSTYHEGLDIAFPTETKVMACESGTVTTAGWYGGLGKCIIINHGSNLQTVYGHLSAIKVKSGQKVIRCQHIGNVGSTGNSTGPHMHLGVKLNGKFVNPEKGGISYL